MVVNPDISSSTKVKAINGGVFTPTNRLGQNINVGVREFIGADIVNGIVEHGGSRACSSTFLAFVDYNKAAIRVGAISRLPILNIYTHDTITVGEDGPTHQPIEQIPSLRLIPNHYLFRPANLDEVISAFNYFIDEPKSACTFLGSRTAFNQIYCQNTKNIKNGGYILINQDKYDLTIIATGSEVATADEVAKILKKQKIIARIVSMPCLEIFNEQSVKYRNEVLGTKPIISIEFAATAPWYKLVDLAIGIDHFGASGKFDDLIRDFQLDPESIAKKIINFLK
jgi:transketolase